MRTLSADAVPTRAAVVIEDDHDAREVVAAVLGQAGFSCVYATTGLEGVDAVREHRPVLTTLDIGLPGIDGFEVARQVRTFSATYLIMISIRDEESDLLMGLDAGADDYLVKPFRPRVLRARVDAMLRRAETDPSRPGAETAGSLPVSRPEVPSRSGDPAAKGWLCHRGLRVNPDMWLCTVDGVPVDLTRSEFDLLVAVVRADRRVVTKHALAQVLRRNGGDSVVLAVDRRAVEVHMANLRRKLSSVVEPPGPIETVRGVGYRLAR